MSDAETSAHSRATDEYFASLSSRDQPPRGGWRRTARRIALRVLVWYVVLAAVLGIFQRSLIYHPTRVPLIRAEDAVLPAGTVHDVSLRTEDGLLLRGWHVLASGRSCATPEDCDRELAEGRLLVLYFPGNAADRRNRIEICRLFTGLGADVFLFDYRGYGDNPGRPHEAGLAADARALWKYATEERNVAPERIVLFGESLGGGVALGLCREVCDAGSAPAGVILQAAFSSLVDAAAHHFPWLPVRLLLLDRYPSAECIACVSCPVLHIHGAEDDIVPLELGQRLFAAAPERSASGVPKRFVELPGVGHNDILFSARGAFLGAVEEFFAALDVAEMEAGEGKRAGAEPARLAPMDPDGGAAP